MSVCVCVCVEGVFDSCTSFGTKKSSQLKRKRNSSISAYSNESISCPSTSNELVFSSSMSILGSSVMYPNIPSTTCSIASSKVSPPVRDAFGELVGDDGRSERGSTSAGHGDLLLTYSLACTQVQSEDNPSSSAVAIVMPLSCRYWAHTRIPGSHRWFLQPKHRTPHGRGQGSSRQTYTSESWGPQAKNMVVVLVVLVSARGVVCMRACECASC